MEVKNDVEKVQNQEWDFTSSHPSLKHSRNLSEEERAHDKFEITLAQYFFSNQLYTSKVSIK